METVNSIASAASRAIWGEPVTAQDSTTGENTTTTTTAAAAATVPETKGTEPLSGVLGDTKKGEPFDKGNMDSTSTSHAIPSSGSDPSITSSSSGLPGKMNDPLITSSSSGLPAKIIADTNIEPLSTSSSSGLSGKVNDPSITSPSSGLPAKIIADTNIEPLSTSSSSGLPGKMNDPSITSPSSGLPAKIIADTNIEPLSTSNNTSPDTSSTNFQTTSEKPLISSHINPNLPSFTDSRSDATTKKELNPSTSTTLPIRSEHQTEKTGVTNIHNPTLGTQTQDIKPSESTHVGAPEENTGIAAAKKESVGANADADVSGPGPRTLEEIARDNGGVSTGVASEKPSSTANMQNVETDLKPKDLDKKEQAQNEGSGEQYVKSSGVKAEGGDFDVTRPGAGREADRLLGKEGKVEKSEVGGVTVLGGGSGEGRKSISSEDGDGEGKKEGKLTHLKEKIKEKLHKH